MLVDESTEIGDLDAGIESLDDDSITSAKEALFTSHQ